MKGILGFVFMGVLIINLCGCGSSGSAWENWLNSGVLDYLESEQVIVQGIKDLEQTFSNSFMKAGSLTAAQRVTKYNGEYLLKFIQELESLDPPPELQSYHEKKIKSYRYKLKSYEEYSTGRLEVEDLGKYEVQGAEMMLSALEDLRAVFVEHSAPDSEIKAIEEQMDFIRKALDAYSNSRR